MKLFCTHCGIHFPQDFDITLKPICNFWGEHGMGNVPTDLKKEVWDWLFLMPSDKMAIVVKLGFAFSFQAQPIQEEDKFEVQIPNWNELNEKEKQEYQRLYFKNKTKGLLTPLPIKKKPGTSN